MSGFIIYEGPSSFDGAPIVVIATTSSRNAKTGDMIQTWILRSDIAPRAALNSGADVSICGDCPLRGDHGKNRACYVRIDNAPRSVFDAYQRGVYSRRSLGEAKFAFKGKRVRLGAYGDPAAVPFGFWEFVLANAAGVTGYTHAWRYADRRFARFVMASADSAGDVIAAQAIGYRTFHVRADGASKAKKEVICPASSEAGHKTSCADCMACGGLSSKAKASIVIIAHGAGASAFARLENRNV